MKTTMKKEVEVDAKTLSIHLKVSDRFCANLKDQDGDSIKSYEGYVPSFMPGEHYGDYVILDIEIDSGKITNWKSPTAADLESFIAGDGE